MEGTTRDGKGWAHVSCPSGSAKVPSRETTKLPFCHARSRHAVEHVFVETEREREKERKKEREMENLKVNK